MSKHVVSLAAKATDDGNRFRAECTCGWVTTWRYTNACMGDGRRHAAHAEKP